MERDPADVIRGQMADPQEVLTQLKGFEPRELEEYRDQGHNNLIHIMVKELGLPSPGDDLPKDLQPLIQYLKACGVDINEVNDLRESPLFLSQLVEGEPYELGYVLEGFGARPIYFSIAPEIRAIQKWLR